MITYLLVVGPIAGFFLGVFVTTMCMSAREGDRGMVDLSGAAARGDLDLPSRSSQFPRPRMQEIGKSADPPLSDQTADQVSFVDRIGRTAADDPRGGRTW